MLGRFLCTRYMCPLNRVAYCDRFCVYALYVLLESSVAAHTAEHTPVICITSVSAPHEYYNGGLVRVQAPGKGESAKV